MQFSDIHENSGTKFTKLAIVAALHVAVGFAVVRSIDTVDWKAPLIENMVTKFIPDDTPPPLPPKPEDFKLAETKMDVVIPIIDHFDIKPLPDTIQGKVADDIPVAPPSIGPVTKGDPVALPTVTTGAMHTAVLADANACRKPDYPARAARMGEQGTVSLALLVGVDGKVASARVQSSSGSRELDRAAVSALSLCQFKPATSGGVPEQAWAQIAYVWTLE